MIALRYKFNSAMTELVEGQKPELNCCPVLLKDGDFRRLDWLGFIDLEDTDVVLMKGGKMCKLDIRAYSVAVGDWQKWRNLDKDTTVQGCALGRGVYAVVVNGHPKLIAR